jgi:hypothetical protein
LEELNAACTTKVTLSASKVQLSVARRNIGAVSYRDKAYFAGGCVVQGVLVQDFEN